LGKVLCRSKQKTEDNNFVSFELNNNHDKNPKRQFATKYEM